ncbi:MAG TPA: hypothetical protein VMQ86_16440 [Bryobacteraceae bacterium]|jgi:hypothetical protein|nr:hypothetical protein [Bryobacteraceae bacterium]
MAKVVAPSNVNRTRILYACRIVLVVAKLQLGIANRLSVCGIQDPDFLRPVEDRGQSIGIHQGSREGVQLGLIP